MPPELVHLLTYLLLGLIWLFFVRVIYAVVTEIREQSKLVKEAVAEISMSSGAKVSPLKLRVIEPPEYSNLSFELTDDVTIGRASTCNISIEYDFFSSALNSRIFVKDNKLWIEDLGSRNGTLVNGKIIGKPTRIKRGDIIQVGNTVFEVYR